MGVCYTIINTMPRLGLLAPRRKQQFLACDAFVRTNRRATAAMFVHLSVCLSGTGVYCDHTVQFSADLSSWLDSPMSWAP